MNELRHSEASDLGEIAECHMRVFPDALASYQGVKFVKKMLEWYIISDRGVLFHLVVDRQIVGYCGGIRIYKPGLPGAFTSISQHAFWTFIRSTLQKPWLFFHRDNIKRHRMILRNIMIRLGVVRAAKRSNHPEVENFKTSWGLVVIGVDPAHQGRGFGSKILAEFERLALNDGVDYIRLSVKQTNKQAIASYRRNGWQEVSRSKNVIQMIKEFTLPNRALQSSPQERLLQ